MTQQLKSRNRKVALIWQQDYLFQSYWMTKFINSIMANGKKQRAIRLVYYVLNNLRKEILGTNQTTSFLILFELLQKIKPVMGMAKFKRGKGRKQRVHYIPVPIFVKTAYKNAIRWIRRAILIKDIKYRKRENRLFKKNYSLRKRNVKKNKAGRNIIEKDKFIQNKLLTELISIHDDRNSSAFRIKEAHNKRIYENRTLFHFRWR